MPLASPCSPFISIHKPRFCNNNTTWLTLHEVQNRYLSMYTSLPSSLHVWQSFITIGWCQKVGVFVLLLGLCLAMAICHRSQSVHSYNSGQKSCITTTGWCQKVVVPVLQAQLTATGSNSRLCIGSFFHSGKCRLFKSYSGTVATRFPTQPINMRHVKFESNSSKAITLFHYL